MPVKPERAPLAHDAANGGMALLIIDMISTWDFEDGDAIARAALAIAPKIGALKGRCARTGVPVVFVNDNRGRWRSEFRELVRVSKDESETGAAIAGHLLPGDDDYSVLKPKHSAFYATPLDLLLRHLLVQRLLVTGVTSDQCIVLTAAEARMRDYDVVVPGDCVGAQTPTRNAAALRQLREAHEIETLASTSLRLPARRKGR
ncbi:MAG TPA: isochorismatase family cysteine hydrolase [Caldimonas sp.]|nr:isochorismatase family cysteine hydrolase [Caldimonas sp.]HEX4233748.1 isochorismatase family cysteine hydrolase [Caldimonas sp.]